MASRSRLGVLQQAILDRDPVTILAEIERRATPTDDGCLLWSRTSPDGYPMLSIGRGQERYAHRIAVWAAEGCLGSLSDLPAVHHRCARRSCVRTGGLADPQGGCLVLVTSLLNTVEAQARAALVARIGRLEDVVRSLDPQHKVLDHPELAGGDVTWLARGPQTATPARLAEQEARRAARRASLAAHADHRYAQVRAVRQLLEAGMPRAEALQRVRISRAALDRWTARLDRIEAGDGD